MFGAAIKRAWGAGISGQPLPADVDESAGRTAAICGIMGVTVLVVFGASYASGCLRRWLDPWREGEDLEETTIEEEAREASDYLRNVDEELHRTIGIDHPEEERWEDEEEIRQDPETGEFLTEEEKDIDDFWNEKFS